MFNNCDIIYKSETKLEQRLNWHSHKILISIITHVFDSLRGTLYCEISLSLKEY